MAKRSASSASYWRSSSAPAALQPAPASAHSRKTCRGEKRSAIVSAAKASVPPMKPNCTAEVSEPTAAAGSCQSRCRSGITALTANHSDVPASCDSTMVGRMRFGTAASESMRAARPGWRLAAGTGIGAPAQARRSHRSATAAGPSIAALAEAAARPRMLA